MCRRNKVLEEFEGAAFEKLRERGHFHENEDWYQWYFLACLQAGGYAVEFKQSADRAMAEYFSYIRSFA
ncbi:MAG: hypothetical protein QG620_678 [Patescibacteria group bacterium]|nr:hypothetical protein [Patescibacteria group bacterium]